MHVQIHLHIWPTPVIVRWGPSFPAWPGEQSRVLSPNWRGGLTPLRPTQCASRDTCLDSRGEWSPLLLLETSSDPLGETGMRHDSVFPSNEIGVLGKFWGGIKGSKYCFALQDGTWDFSWDAVVGKGLILRRRWNHVAFLELWRDSRVSMGNTVFLMCWAREVLSSIRV